MEEAPDASSHLAHETTASGGIEQKRDKHEAASQ
jgi:hypothetical protein